MPRLKVILTALAEILVRGDGWSHDVLVGPLRDAAPRIAQYCRDYPTPLVSDDHLLTLHGDKLQSLAAFEPIAVPRGEASKGWDTLRQLVARFSDLGITRQTPIVAFGGGSIGDVAGLAAALFKRGCPIVHIPTTLLAQVDSAVGGKTAIDDCGQKNLVGTFHPPALVVCDPEFLETLDERQYRAGYAEIVKYGLIDDEPFFRWCEENGSSLLARDRDAQKEAISHCVSTKARFVESDLEDRSGRRALLNFGHSFAHAIEAVAGFGNILHGEAVAIGSCMAFDLSVSLGHCAAEQSERVRSHFAFANLPISLADIGLDGRAAELLPLIAVDKKAGHGGLTLILTEGIGKAFVFRDLDRQLLADFLGQAG